MQGRTILFELLMAGFFAVACVRAHAPIDPGHGITFGEFFQLSDRLERLRRTRWQWFSMVGLMLMIRLQQPIPLAIELMVALQFVVFLALPAAPAAPSGVRRR